MYDAGRESNKKSPSPLLWVVCYYLNEGQDQEDDIPLVAPPAKSDFTDGASYIIAMKEYQAAKPAKERTGLKVSPLHYRISSFIAQRKLEAQMLSAHGLLPDNIPYDKQPAWKWNLWSSYWSGENDERDRMKA